ncbi:hypothetical protein HKD37_19G054413 [Glycine soja]
MHRRYLEFPSFMYATTVLVVSDATLEDTGCVAALAMAASALVVGLPESTHLVTKQLSVGQLVKVFVSTVVDSGRTGVAVHPVHVIYIRLYAKNTCERFDCNIETISASDNSTAAGFIAQVKSLSTTGAKLLQSIRSKQDGMHWEWPQTRIFHSHWIDPEDKLQDLELTIRVYGHCSINLYFFSCWGHR